MATKSSSCKNIVFEHLTCIAAALWFDDNADATTGSKLQNKIQWILLRITF
jgi:hypothetical protein